MQNNYDFLFKILLIGDLKVGKSSILLRYVDNTFSEQFLPNIGVDFKIKTIDCQGKQVKLQIWDTAGQERFKTITSSFYKGALGILVVFDISNRDSFNNLSQWMNEIKKHTSEEVVLVLVGNKLDIQEKREVSTVDAQAFASQLNITYIETSSMNSLNIELPFIRIVDELLQKQKQKDQ